MYSMQLKKKMGRNKPGNEAVSCKMTIVFVSEVNRLVAAESVKVSNEDDHVN